MIISILTTKKIAQSYKPKQVFLIISFIKEFYQDFIIIYKQHCGPVQSLSACTVQLYLYCPMGRMACAEHQCLYSTAIPLIPLWAVRPIESLSACTVQLHLYSPYGPYCL